jgi:protein dithiol oxidoreductase (disulfide-forming)
MTRLACFLLALALPLAACDANTPSQTPPAPVTDTAPQPATKAPETAQQKPATQTAQQPAPAEETPADDSIEELAAVEEPSGENAAAQAPVKLAQAPNNEPFQEGKDYVRFPAAQPTSSPPDQVEIAEAFMYSCPHCYAFEPELSKWLSHRPANTTFIRLPVNFNPTAALHMRAYYAAQTLGVLDSIHQAFFDEIHLHKNPLADVDSLTKFFVAHGVDEKALKDAMSSFAIDSQTRKTEALLRRYQIASVPTLIINGKYRTDVGMAGSYTRCFEIVEFLIHKEQTEGGAAAPKT